MAERIDEKKTKTKMMMMVDFLYGEGRHKRQQVEKCAQRKVV